MPVVIADDSTIGEDLVSAEMFCVFVCFAGIGLFLLKPDDFDESYPGNYKIINNMPKKIKKEINLVIDIWVEGLLRNS